MRALHINRNGQWLELDFRELAAVVKLSAPALAEPTAGSHPHAVRQWLLASSLFPAKWINRLFSIGGIRWSGQKLQLLAFPPIDPSSDLAYQKALLPETSSAPEVLYEDLFCIVFHKPAGMPVHESVPNQRGTLDEAAARHMLTQEDPLLVRHIHRLDDDTSGPVLYAKNDLAQWKLDEEMRNKSIDRHYIAAVHGRVAKSADTISLPIGKDRHHSQKRRVSMSGELAVTHYEVLEAGKTLTLLRVRLETGKTHQIRVHLSYIGHPLVGDGLYGGDTRTMQHQALHGEKLIFPHPWHGEIVEVTAPWPPWLEQLAQNISPRSK